METKKENELKELVKKLIQDTEARDLNIKISFKELFIIHDALALFTKNLNDGDFILSTIETSNKINQAIISLLK
jgi:hypothetical protein